MLPLGSAMSTTPCPSGFVQQTAETISTQTLTEQIERSLIPIPMETDVELPTCQPMATVAALGTWVTIDDCLQVLVQSSVPTVGLVVTARVLSCDIKLSYLSYDLSKVPANQVSIVQLPLGPGYLLDVCASAQGSSISGGTCYVALGIQHTCQSGRPPQNQLAQGYVSSTYSVSWPATPGGVPIQQPTQTGPTPSGSVYQSRAVWANSGPLSATFAQNVLAGDLLVAMVANTASPLNDAVVDSTSTNWTRAILGNVASLWYRANAPAGPLTVTYSSTSGSSPPYHVDLLEIYGPPTSTVPDATADAHGTNPQTATTGTTNYTDVALSFCWADGTAGNEFNIPLGWSRYTDVVDGSGRRTSTFAGQNSVTSGSLVSFTASRASAVYVEVMVATFVLH